MKKLKEQSYFLYFPDDDLEEFSEEDLLLERIQWLVEFRGIAIDDMRVITGKEYQVGQTVTFNLEE